MIVFSFNTAKADRGKLVVVVILTPENLDRMKIGDPADIKLKTFLSPVNGGEPARNIDLVVAYEEDIGKIAEFAQSQDLAGLLQHLQRAREHQPGDCQPAVPLRKN